MIGDLKPYPAMKDSGVEWLGEVPEHWEVRRTKSNVTNVIDQTSEREKDDAYIALEHVQSWTGRISDAGSEVEFDSQVKRFRRNDVLFGKLRPYLAKVARPVRDGVCVGEFLVLRADEQTQTSNFLEQLMRSKPVIDVINASTFGAKMPRADWNFIGSLPQALPPLPEQAAIVRYLDHVDRRVRRLTRAKRKLIALLTEQKQAIIHRAVTRGLDPDVPLKDSGVEWLGEVPEHWEVRRSKQTFTQRKELARPEDIQLSATQAYGAIAQDDYEQRVGRKVVKVFLHLEKRRHVEMDDFVISMRSFQGGLERAWVSGCIRSSYVVLRPIAEVDVGFFSYLFKSRGYIGALQSTADFIRDGQDLNFANFCGVDLPVPPLEEQRRIADSLQEALDDASRVMTRAEREIELLNEYRTRLIADVVTGKLDVRDAAAALPEVDPLAEADDADDLDADLAPHADELDEALEEAEA